MHLNLEAALVQAARIGARRTYLTHLSHEVHHATVSARLPTGVALAHDGLVLDLPADGAETR
jgi:phosphoribosyl 1,2-cyclic phosphate phosphodiesterase